MKKIILNVRQSGLMFTFNGKKFRSPAEIDITHMKIDPIISQMRSYGITNYEISTIENIIGLAKKESQTKVVIMESNNEDEINKLNSKVEKIEYMLHEILNQNKEKEWEQNNKDVIKTSNNKKQIDENNISKKPKIEELIDEKTIKTKSDNKPVSVEENENDLDFVNKKIIVEELEDIKDNINIEIDDVVFETKEFNYSEINEPFKLSSDVEELSKYKK